MIREPLVKAAWKALWDLIFKLITLKCLYMIVWYAGPVLCNIFYESINTIEIEEPKYIVMASVSALLSSLLAYYRYNGGDEQMKIMYNIQNEKNGNSKNFQYCNDNDTNRISSNNYERTRTVFSAHERQNQDIQTNCIHSTYKDTVDHLTHGNLPDDIMIHLCNYLHPRDVCKFACVNQSAMEMIDGDRTENSGGHSGDTKLDQKDLSMTVSCNLWKSLWYRDYGQVLIGMENQDDSRSQFLVGRDAIRTSLQNMINQKDLDTQQSPIDPISLQEQKDTYDHADISFHTRLTRRLDKMHSLKHFYFSFAETYMDYILAGKNTPQHCLMGMHGHIFDFTSFADYHPGLSEPILLQCGGDVTQYFEELPHSSVARKIARKLCIIVDQSCTWNTNNGSDSTSKKESQSCCGLYRLPCHDVTFVSTSNSRPPSDNGWDDRQFKGGLRNFTLPSTSFTKTRRSNTLYKIRHRFDRERKEILRTSFGSASPGSSKESSSSWKLWGEEFNTFKQTILSRRKDKYLDMHPEGKIRVYYDPFEQRWKSWYTRFDMQPVYCD